MPASETVLAIDVGGTKIAAGVVDRPGALLRSAFEPDPARGTTPRPSSPRC